MGFSKGLRKPANREPDKNSAKSPAAEFVIDLEKREEQLVNRIYKLSHLLSTGILNPAQEEQITLILEDALAELDTHIKQLQPLNRSKSWCLFN